MSGSTYRGLPFPPDGPTTVGTTIPSYLYAQYNDDDALQAFVSAYNIMSQWAVDWFNQVNLPLWSGLSGGLLDWIGAGLYGIPRPQLSLTTSVDFGGPYNAAPYDTIEYDGAELISSSVFLLVTDDIYRRILTWHLYKGDGYQFSMRWLKQRIHRFLVGQDGWLDVNDTTDDVSIAVSGAAFTISIANNPIGEAFQFAVSDKVVALPFEYSFTVNLV